MDEAHPPDDTPPGVICYWEAKERWYATGTHKPPTRDEFVKIFKPPISTRTLDRIRHDHPELVGHWPPKRTDQPLWRAAVLMPPVDTQAFNVVDGEIHTLRRVRTAGLDDDGNPVKLVQEYDSVDGRLVNSYIDEPTRHLHQLPAVAATCFGIIDAMADGHLDGVVRLCKLIGCIAGWPG